MCLRLLQRTAGGGYQFVVVVALYQIVECAVLHGLHRIADGAERREHDHLRIRLLTLDRSGQFHPIGIGQLHIAKHNMETLGFQPLNGLGAGLGSDHSVAFAHEQALQHVAQLGFVVDDEE